MNLKSEAQALRLKLEAMDRVGEVADNPPPQPAMTERLPDAAIEAGRNAVTGYPTATAVAAIYLAMRPHDEQVKALAEAAREAKQQLEYLDSKFPATGTTATVIARTDAALARFTAEGRG